MEEDRLGCTEVGILVVHFAWAWQLTASIAK